MVPKPDTPEDRSNVEDKCVKANGTFTSYFDDFPTEKQTSFVTT